jgi:hypothetical protein
MLFAKSKLARGVLKVMPVRVDAGVEHIAGGVTRTLTPIQIRYYLRFFAESQWECFGQVRWLLRGAPVLIPEHLRSFSTAYTFLHDRVQQLTFSYPAEAGSVSRCYAILNRSDDTEIRILFRQGDYRVEGGTRDVPYSNWCGVNLVNGRLYRSVTDASRVPSLTEAACELIQVGNSGKWQAWAKVKDDYTGNYPFDIDTVTAAIASRAFVVGHSLWWKVATTDVLRVLLDSGIDLNTRDRWGRTMLFYAWDAASVRAILKHGVDVNVLDAMGKTARDELPESGGIASMLRKAGAKYGRQVAFPNHPESW